MTLNSLRILLRIAHEEGKLYSHLMSEDIDIVNEVQDYLQDKLDNGRLGVEEHLALAELQAIIDSE